MTNEQWNTTLYKQMFAEQEQFRDWLLTQPPQEILNHAYEYVMREDILLSLEYNDLTDAQAAALLTSPSPLVDVYAEFDKLESSHMEEIWSCIESRANALQTDQLDRAKTLIDEFCAYEYASQADFSDLSRVNIAYTTVGDEDIPLQVHVDLEGYKIERELDGKPLDTRQYSSLQELIENELEGLDFQELVAVDEKDIQLLARREVERQPRASVREQLKQAQEKMEKKSPVQAHPKRRSRSGEPAQAKARRSAQFPRLGGRVGGD